MSCADANQVPAGGALAVDREGFAQAVTEAIEADPLITIAREEVTGLPPADWDQTIIATGPLTAPGLAEAISAETGQDALAFFDAIAPIIHISIRSTCRSAGSSRAMTRWVRAAPARTTSTVRWTRISTRPSSTR
jgi:tRNA:m(5)U-54 methyltransferase